jgi:glucose/arabinose dehydrogenase
MSRIELPAAGVFTVLVCGSLAMRQAAQVERRADPAIWVREGFSLTIAQADIDRARFLAFAPDGTLLVSQPDSGQIQACREEDGDGDDDEQQTVIPDGPLPKGGHWRRSILIHKGRRYTSIGDRGNITDETRTDRQKIWTYDLEGKDKKLFASGLRHTEKLVIRPGTDEVWGTDHGSDWFGQPIEGKKNPPGQPITDQNPPDEMNP